MQKITNENGDIVIIYQANEFGIIVEKGLGCCMCGELAFFLVENNEPLCAECYNCNLEARKKK